MLHNHIEPRASSGWAKRCGFTLVEILVVIAIIALLIALILPAAARCTFLSRQARELSAAQQLMVAFTLYADDNRGVVLPGYPPKAMVNGPIEVTDHTGERIFNEQAQRYPWRLAPYLDYNFKGLYKDDRLLDDIRSGEPGYKKLGVDFRYVVSLFPSLGMNVAFVGGSEKFLGFDQKSQQMYGRFYITRNDEPRHPCGLIVFASARCEVQSGIPQLGKPEGFFRVEPPVFTAPLWQATYDEDAQFPGLNSGFVSLRRNGRAVTGMLVSGRFKSTRHRDVRRARRGARLGAVA